MERFRCILNDPNQDIKGLGFIVGFRSSFICQGTSPGDSEGIHYGLRVKLPPVTTSLTTQRYIEAILLSALPKDTTSKLAVESSHYPFYMLNVKQGSCEYQL